MFSGHVCNWTTVIDCLCVWNTENVVLICSGYQICEPWLWRKDNFIFAM